MKTPFWDGWEDYFAGFSLAFALLTFTWILIRGISSRSNTHISSDNSKNYSDIIESIKSEDSSKIPFEIEQLAKYYTQILNQTKLSFIFSLVCALSGFIVLIVLMLKNDDITLNKTLFPSISTVIIESVSLLFFSRTNKAQKEMEQFFNKLRSDRQQGEARKLADDIESPILKDILKVQLALSYSEIPNDTKSLNEAIQKAASKALDT